MEVFLNIMSLSDLEQISLVTKDIVLLENQLLLVNQTLYGVVQHRLVKVIVICAKLRLHLACKYA
jgi:hypothetical protein